ncbi:hypothetical protein BH09GEM1_BH09GEM1_30370 [soil metagenome]
MRKITLAASFIIAPALVQAQSSGQAQAGVNASVSGSASVGRSGSASASSSTQASGSASAARSPQQAFGAASGSQSATARSSEHRLGPDAQSKVDANLRVARERRLPEEPIRQRVAEGQAKGASDAQIAAASGRTLVDLQGSFDAMVRGGHTKPSDAEVSRGASLIARGYSAIQLEGVARNAGSERSLVTAFDVLTSLSANGMSSTNAVAKVESQLAAHASDAQLVAVAANAAATGGLAGALGSSQGGLAGSASTSVAGSAAAGAGAAAGGVVSGATSGASAAGGVSGAVHGVLGKP